MRFAEDIDCAFPRTLADALKLQAAEKTRGRLLAGGTDLMVQWSSGALPIDDRAVSLAAVPELRGLCEDGDRIVIGATATHAQIRSSALVRQHLPALAAAAATVGGAQIQARGTIGGNVANASPAGDLAPALLVTDGAVVVASASGEREIPLTKFYLGYRKIDLRPDEIIVRFVLPKMRDGERELFRKLGPRAAQAISKVMGACRARVVKGTVKSFAVALGSVAPVPSRLPEFESWIKGEAIGKKVLDEAERRVSESLKPIADIRSTAEYRKWVSGRIVRGFLEELASS